MPKSIYGADDDIVILYLCNEGEGTILHDSSGRKNDARIEGAVWVKGIRSDCWVQARGSHLTGEALTSHPSAYRG